MKAPRIEVEYPSAGALHVELETQLLLGGLLLDVPPPPGLLVGTPVALCMMLRAPDGTPIAFELEALVGELDKASLCLDVEEAEVARLRAGAQERIGGGREGAAVPTVRFYLDGAEVRVAVEETASAPVGGVVEVALDLAPLELDRAPSVQSAVAVESVAPAPARIDPIERRLAAMSVGEKIQQALHGGREWRQLLGRDRAGVIQSALVRNPKISLDEVVALARGPALAPDAAEALAQHSSFGSSPQIALALVRNPRTPLTTAVGLVSRLATNDLRTVAKGLGVRAQVAGAARKRLAGER